MRWGENLSKHCHGKGKTVATKTFTSLNIFGILCANKGVLTRAPLDKMSTIFLIDSSG